MPRSSNLAELSPGRTVRSIPVLVTAGFLAFTLPGQTLASTPPGGGPVVTDTGTSNLPLLLGVVGAVLVIALAAFRRPRWRRRIGAALLGIVIGFLGLISIGVGLFSDFSGRHEVNPVLVVGGILVIVVGVVVAVVVGRQSSRGGNAA
jgi:hypothetical protein